MKTFFSKRQIFKFIIAMIEFIVNVEKDVCYISGLILC